MSFKIYTSLIRNLFLDLDQGQLLQLIKLNLNQNKELLKAHVQVNELDFFNLDWSTDLNEMVESTDIVLAADGNSNEIKILTIKLKYY